MQRNLLIHLDWDYIPGFNMEKLQASMSAMNERLGQAGGKMNCSELIHEILKEKGRHDDPVERATIILAAFVAAMQEKECNVYVLKGNQSIGADGSLNHIDIVMPMAVLGGALNYFDMVMPIQDLDMIRVSQFRDMGLTRLCYHEIMGKSPELPKFVYGFIESKGLSLNSPIYKSIYPTLEINDNNVEKAALKVYDVIFNSNRIDRSKYSLSETAERAFKVPKMTQIDFLTQKSRFEQYIESAYVTASSSISEQPSSNSAKELTTVAFAPSPQVSSSLIRPANGFFDKVKSALSRSKSKDIKRTIDKSISNPGERPGLTSEESTKMSRPLVSRISLTPRHSHNTSIRLSPQEDRRVKTDIKGKGLSRN